MKLTTEMFNKPDKHPFGMLSQYQNANQKETVLTWMLARCIEAGSFIEIEMSHEHLSLVKDGLLEKTGTQRYKLTLKALGFLHEYFGKED